MDLRLLEQSPEMAPILVRLYESQKLYNLASDQSPLARAELTGAIAELIEKDLGLREQELISDLLINLMRQAEKDLREALAERLSTLENAPLRIILHMANDDISIARPVLRSSPVLSDLDLMYIIKLKTSEYWHEIAARARLGESVINALAETHDDATGQVLAGNKAIRMTEKAFDILGAMAEGSENLARPLLMRNDVPKAVARHLYEYVGQELRDYIRVHFDASPESVGNAINDVIIEFAQEPHNQFMPTPIMLQAADAMAQSGRLSMGAMIEPLQRGQFASFIALFSRFCGMTPENVHEMIGDPSGKMLAIACRALNLSKADLSRIYLMTQRVRSADRIVDHNELMRALAAYDSVSVSKAQNALRIQPK